MSKKNLDRILVLFVLIVSIIITGSAGAQDVSTMSISEAEALLGTEITLDVSFTGNPGVSGIEFWVNYDKDILTYTGLTDGNITGWQDDKNSTGFAPGKIHLMWWNSNTINFSNGIILKLNFSVSENASGGKTEITVSDAEFTGKNDDVSVDFNLSNGSVTVKSVSAGASNISPIYDGQPHSITVNVTEPTSGYTIKYGTAEGTYDLDEVPTITNVSAEPLTVYYQVTADSYAPANGSAAVTISPKTITAISGLKAVTKEYDGNTNAELDTTASLTFEGMVSGDSLTVNAESAAFSDKNAGENKNVTFSGLTLGGTSAGNYTLAQDAKSTTGKGVITKKTVTIEGLAVEEKIYDGTTTATLVTTGVSFPEKIEGDNFSITGAAVFEDANAGENKTVKYPSLSLEGGDAENYVLPSSEIITTNGKITRRPITITAKNQTVPLNGSIDEDPAQVTVTSVLNPAIVSNDSLSWITLTDSGTTSATDSGTITPSAAVIIIDAETTAMNYDITYVAGILTVTKADPVVTAPTAIENLQYTGVAQPLINAGSTTGGELTYFVDDIWRTEIPTGTSAGNYTVYFKVEGNENYNSTEAQSLTVTMDKAPLTVTANPQTITYGDEPGNNGVSYEGFVNDELEDNLSGELIFSYGYSQYGDTGSYTITPSGLTADNYTLEYKSGTLTVNQKEVGLTWSADALTFNGSEQAPEASVTETVNGDEISVTVIGKETNAGSGYIATASALVGSKAGNYKLPEENTTTFSIAKADAPILANIQKQEIYTAASLSISNVSFGFPENSGTLTYTAGTATNTGSVTVSDFAVSTDGTVTATLSGGALSNTITLPVTIGSTNYENSTVNVVVTLVDKTNAGVTISGESSLTKTYGDDAFTLTASVTNDGKGTGTWTWSSTNDDVAEVAGNGTTATVTIKAASDTAVTIKTEYSSDTTKGEASVTLTVNKADTVVTGFAAVDNLTYTGVAQALVTAGSTTGGELQYAVTASDAAAAPSSSDSWSTTPPSQINAGNYLVWYKVIGNSNYNDKVASSIPAAISKAALTITAKPKTITYGDEPANDGVSYDGFVNSETESVLTGTLAYEYNYTQYGDAGSYTIKPSGLTADNYEITYQTGTLTVDQKEVGLTWSNTSLTYITDSEQAPTAEATGTVNNDLIGVTVTGGQTNAGDSYTATASGLTGAKAGSYKLPAENTTTFSIAKTDAPDSLKSASGSAKYGTAGTVDLSSLIASGGTVGMVTVTDTDSVLDGAPSVSGGILSFKFVNNAEKVGKTASITIPVGEATNYNDYEIAAVVTVVDKLSQTIEASDMEVTYGEMGKRVTAERSVGDGALSYTVTAGSEYVSVDAASGVLTTLKAGGPATVTVTAVETDNYKEETITLSVTVNKADVQVTTQPAVINGLVYDEAAHELITAGVLTDGGTMKYALGTDGTTVPDDSAWSTDVPVGTNIDTYYVWYRIDGDENHNNIDPTFLGTVSIAKKPMTVSAAGYEGIYDGAAHGITVTVTEPASDYEIRYGTTEGTYDQETSPMLTNVGTLTVYYQVSAATYDDAVGSATVTIREKGIFAKAEDVSVPYDGKPHGINVTVTEPESGYTVNFGREEGNYYLTETPMITETWESPLRVYYQVTAPNYEPVSGSAVVTINGIVAVAEDVTVTHDGEPHGITVLVTEPAGGYTVKYGLEEGVYDLDESPTITDVGTLIIYYQVSAPAYGVVTGSAAITIHPLPGHTVKVTSDGMGNASAVPEYGMTGTEVTLTATPEYGYLFKEWKIVSGDVSVADGRFKIGTEDVEIQAVFMKSPYIPLSPDDNSNDSEISGNDQTYVIGSGQPRKFRIARIEENGSDSAYDRFEKALNSPGGGIRLTIGDKEFYPVLHRDYDYSRGSVIITLYPQYLDSLPVGEYVLETFFMEDSGDIVPFGVDLSVTEPKNIVFRNIRGSGQYNTPDDIEDAVYDLTIQIVDGEKILMEAKNVELNVRKNVKDIILEGVQFRVLNNSESVNTGAAYKLAITGFPKEVFGYQEIFDGDSGRIVKQIRNKYTLSVHDVNLLPDGKLLIYLKWDDGAHPAEEPKVYALPEDEIGAYTLRKDGTKEYLLFHTYDICMQYLGSDELCRGYERCFHKESPYVNPFVK